MRCPLVFDCRDEEEKDMNVPQHVAIILDGNGRWAKSKGMPRNYGTPREARTWNASVRMLTKWVSNT